MLTLSNQDVSLCAALNGSTRPNSNNTSSCAVAAQVTCNELVMANQHLQMYTKQACRHSNREPESSLAAVKDSTASVAP